LPEKIVARGKGVHIDNREPIEINDEIRYSEVEIIGAELSEAMESMKAII
jgi:ketol-acid reductoisomerase